MQDEGESPKSVRRFQAAAHCERLPRLNILAAAAKKLVCVCQRQSAQSVFKRAGLFAYAAAAAAFESGQKPPLVLWSVTGNSGRGVGLAYKVAT